MGCKQVLNNFNVFYISHQIFFFCFVVLFMLHPIPGYSHVKGREWWLPLPYSWVRLTDGSFDDAQNNTKALCATLRQQDIDVYTAVTSIMVYKHLCLIWH